MVRFPFGRALTALRRTTERTMWVIGAKSVSDVWKEKAMGAYARTAFLATLKIAGYLALVLGVATVLVVAINAISGGFQDFMLSWAGVFASLAIATLYVLVRRTVFCG